MKYVVKFAILAVAFVNLGCPSRDNPGGASVVGTPTTQCMSSIPTGPGGQVGGYPQTYPYNTGYNNSCYYGYGANPYFMPYNYGWNNGFACPARYIAAYSPSLGLSCVATYGIPYNNLMYYSYYSGWSNAYYMNYSAYAWNSYYTAVSCVSSYPGCNCIPTGNGTSGIGICTR